MDQVVIRKAKFEDAAEMANVHISSWREAYRGLMPQDFLDERPLYFKNRLQLWKRVTIDDSQISFVAECPKNGVVGFINGSKPRDAAFSDHIEVYCIYLLQKYHGQKVGFQLLKNFFDEATRRGEKKAYLWVLKGNPTIRFYEKCGAINTGLEKDCLFANEITVHDLCYRWDDLKLEKKI